MAKTFFTGQKFNECTELQEARNTPRIDLPHLDLAHNVLNHLAGAIHCLHIWRCDENISIFMNIDIHARFVNDLTDNLAARSNDVANLINVNGNDFHTRCIG